jgi:hypothetical protein
MYRLLPITKEEEQEALVTLRSPLYSFMYALKSSEAGRQYPKRLKMLFDYLKLQVQLEEQAQQFWITQERKEFNGLRIAS